ncbi:hypothetical protein HanLR1_Chr14g0531291 [Helianthus annuus]|nr:hypothetical protein HanHA89_Chr14g0568911 [Helianthus annuus]KAJ0656042.1 hypothetical protein HanLR1_Chr14g0531291 [Helianthus annuus]
MFLSQVQSTVPHPFGISIFSLILTSMNILNLKSTNWKLKMKKHTLKDSNSGRLQYSAHALPFEH